MSVTSVPYTLSPLTHDDNSVGFVRFITMIASECTSGSSSQGTNTRAMPSSPSKRYAPSPAENAHLLPKVAKKSARAIQEFWRSRQILHKDLGPMLFSMKSGTAAFYGQLTFGNSPSVAKFVALSDTSTHGLVAHVVQKHCV